MTRPETNRSAATSGGTVDAGPVFHCDTDVMDGSPVRVAILDDHEMMRQGFVAWLAAATAGLQVVITAATWADLIAHPAFPVDVVLLDLDLGDGIPVAPKIALLRSSGVSVVMVSQYADPARVRECIAAGALGYVPKSEPFDEIVTAVKAATAGQSYMTAHLAEMLVADQGLGSADARPKLSQRELEAFVLFASGLPMKSVARQMGITFDTAKGYIDRVKEKYARAGRDARTKIALRSRAIQDGYIAGD